MLKISTSSTRHVIVLQLGDAMRYWVYILACAGGRYYVGSHRGEDIASRVAEHNDGKFPDAWTYKRRPVELLWSQEFQLALQAIAVERQLKGWRREKKEAVIRGDWRALTELSTAYTRLTEEP